MNAGGNIQLLQQEHRTRFEKYETYRGSVWKILCRDFFSKYVPENATVLDLGAGWGEFINNIRAAKKLAMDLNPETQEHLTDGITFLNQDCTQPWEVGTGTVDVVFTSNFLEHVPDKSGVEYAISEAHRSLKEGGAIICLGPNIKHVLGAYWDFWDHAIPLTERSVSEVLAMHGFVVERSLARFLPYSMSQGHTPPLFMVKLYCMLPLIWPLVGKQFLVIGRKL